MSALLPAPLDSARHVVAVSPHLDDAAFSVGGLLALLSARAARVTVLTVFTATVPAPQGFALACQLDKGVPPEADYMGLRRAEDAAAMSELGACARHLGLAEAPHRGYATAAALFGPVLPGDAGTGGEVGRALDAALPADAPDPPDVLLGPLALGEHVDHRHVRDAVRSWAAGRGLPLLLWRDTPYVLRPGVPGPGTGAIAVALSREALDAKVRACAAYASQLGFQFGGPAGAEAALRALAAAEGVRVLGHGAAEVLTGGAGSAYGG